VEEEELDSGEVGGHACGVNGAFTVGIPLLEVNGVSQPPHDAHV
jgi:hypothetical protein